MQDNITILQAGVPKSGNYWLYTIIQNILKENGIKVDSYIKKQPVYKKAFKLKLSQKNQAGVDVISIRDGGIYYGISSFFSDKISCIDEYLRSATHIWTHSPFNKKQINFYKAIDKIIYIIRDPRDVAVSMSDFAFTEYMRHYYPHNFKNKESYLEINLENIVHRWVENVIGHLLNAKELNIKIVFYERMLKDPQKQIQNISKYLDMELDHNKIKNILNKVSYKSMKKDNPDHVNKGKIYRWRQTLTNGQVERVASLAGSTIKYLGYPTTTDASRSELPSLQKSINQRMLIRFLDESRGFQSSYRVRFKRFIRAIKT